MYPLSNLSEIAIYSLSRRVRVHSSSPGLSQLASLGRHHLGSVYMCASNQTFLIRRDFSIGYLVEKKCKEAYNVVLNLLKHSNEIHLFLIICFS